MEGRQDWVRVTPDGGVLTQDGQPVSQMDAPVDVLVPAEAMILCQLELPARSESKLRRALPYALEDISLAPVEALHIAHARAAERGRHWVAAVTHTQMQAWLDQLESAGITPGRLVPDAWALPYEDHRHTQAVLDGRQLLRCPDGAAFAGSPEELAAYQALSGGGPAHEVDGVELDPRHAPLSLLQGSYAGDAERLARGLRAWRWAAAAAGVALLVALAAQIYTVRQLDQELQRLEADAEAVLRDTFPEVQRVVDPRAQFAQALEGLREQADTDSSEFLQLLAEAAPELRRAQLERLGYQRGRLEIALRSGAMDQIEAIRDALARRGLDARLDFAGVAQEGGYQGRLSVGPAT